MEYVVNKTEGWQRSGGHGRQSSVKMEDAVPPRLSRNMLIVCGKIN